MLAETVARAVNQGVTFLRNRKDLRLTRSEFRASHISFSQFGEDLAVTRWLDERLEDVEPFYVDAGAYHPVDHSNTLLLYKRGWRGLNIDLSTTSIAAFKSLRPGDVSVVAALSDRPRRLMVHEYADLGLTNRIAQIGEDPRSDYGEEPIRSSEIETQTLDGILAGIGRDRPIGYLNIDCEGHDMAVLKGLNLDRWRPAIITIEALDRPSHEALVGYLTPLGYSLEGTLYKTLLFIRSANRRQSKLNQSGVSTNTPSARASSSPASGC